MCSGRSSEFLAGVKSPPRTAPSRATTRSHRTSARKHAPGADGKVPAARGWKSAYYEVRERQAFDWPLVSAAIAIKAEGGVVKDARVVLGQVAPVPWRSAAAEKALVGKPVGAASAEAAGKAAVEGAQPMTDNGYKVDLVTTLVRRTVATLA